MMESDSASQQPLPPWTLVTSHGLALLYVAIHPEATVKDIAAALGLTERRIADVIRDLALSELVTITRQGRRNRYIVNDGAHFRHPLVSEVPFHTFLKSVQDSYGATANFEGSLRVRRLHP